MFEDYLTELQENNSSSDQNAIPLRRNYSETSTSS